MNAETILLTLATTTAAFWTEQPGDVSFAARYSRWNHGWVVIKASLPSRNEGSTERFDGTGMWNPSDGDWGLMMATTNAVREASAVRAHVEKTHFDSETQEWF